jgi:hypothetical protein
MAFRQEIADGAPSLSPEKLEREIGYLIPRGNTPNARQVRMAPMPDYVEHREGVSQVGSLSAEAVVREYEAAAKEMEAMGAELIEAARKCEAMTAEVHKTMAFVKDTATAYREDAKKMFTRIEECALLSEQVRKTCEEMRNKIASVPV